MMPRRSRKGKTRWRDNAESDESPGGGWDPGSSTASPEATSFRQAPHHVNHTSAIQSPATAAHVGATSQLYNQASAVQNNTGTQGRSVQTGEAALFPVDVTSSSVANGQDIPSGLVYGAYLGNETRNIVFKRGTDSDYLCSAFRNDLRHYACAFLNTGGGRVGVGVDDGGVARGLQLKRREEDQARLLVHTIMRGFDPPVLPSSYSMVFLPAVRPGPEGRTLKVLRLTFTASPAFAHPSLYQTDQGEVFFKRDGSVEGPLTAAAIQEWVRQKWSGEVSRLQHHVDRLLAHYRLQNHNRAPKSVIGALSSSGTQPGPSSHSTSTENRARQIPMFLVSSNCCEWLWEIVHSGKIYSSVTQSPTL